MRNALAGFVVTPAQSIPPGNASTSFKLFNVNLQITTIYIPCFAEALMQKTLWSIISFRRIEIRYHISENYCQVLELIYVYHVSDDTLSVQVGTAGYYCQDNFKQLNFEETVIGLDIDWPNLASLYGSYGVCFL
ncbi:hypothetical protein V8G54_015941 [Vigna mungo]|uniref:Uncharacterized protein n=1 Tax=Vigna mungo TaxID=3915 RepID=A0AAQ3NK99_VIGMU